MFSQKQVRDLMDSSIVPLRADMALGDAVERILASHHHGLPVVGEDHKIVGFLSEHDCLHFLISSSYYQDTRTLVSDIMRSEVLTVAPGDSVLNLAESMEHSKPKIYPVCEEGKLVGVITRSDVMKSLNESLKNTKVAI